MLQELIAPSNVQFFDKDWQTCRSALPKIRNLHGRHSDGGMDRLHLDIPALMSTR